MDFKARFAGKTSKITKDGDLDANKVGFDEPNNFLGPNRGNSIRKTNPNATNGESK